MAAQSLFAKNPRRFDVPVLLILAFVTLIVGLSLPLMSIDKLVFWHDDYTLFSSVLGLWESGHYVLAVIIFLFSVVFPFVKLAALAGVWFKAFDEQLRDRLIFAVGVLGKWSMLDVFVTALLIVLTQSKGFVDASPRAGLFVFAAAIVLSMVLSVLVELAARR